MAVTRANIETILIRRCGKLLSAAGLDGTTVSGANADLNDGIGSALRTLGYTVASLVSVADSDVSVVADSEIDQLLDLAELRTLESVAGNLDKVTIQSEDQRKQWSDLAARLETTITRMRSRYSALYPAARRFVAPYAGGISRSDKATQEADTDRVGGAFRR